MKNNITISRDELTGRIRIQIDIDTDALYEQDLKNGVDYMFFRASATVDDVKRLEYTLRGLYDILTSINKRKENMNRAAQAQINSMAQQSMLNSNGLTSLPRGLANGSAPLGAQSTPPQYGLLSGLHKADTFAHANIPQQNSTPSAKPLSKPFATSTTPTSHQA